MRYSFASYTATSIGVVVSLATKAVLGATGAGYWEFMKVFLSYGEYSDLGMSEAMRREMSQAIGAGDKPRSQHVSDVVFSFTAVAAIIFATGLVLFAIFFVQNPVLRIGLFATAALAVAQQFYNFMLTLLRTTKKIREISHLIVVNILIVGAVSVSFAYFGGVEGLAFGLAISTVLSGLLAVRLSGAHFRLAWDARETARLLKIGIPMVALRTALVTFLSIDALMIGRLIGYRELGYYAIALMALQQIGSVGQYIKMILFPHIQERYGRSGSLKDSKGLFVRSAAVLSHLLPIVIGATIFLVPALVDVLLPQFREGIPAMQVLVAGYFFVAVNEMSFTLLFTIDKQKRLLPAYVLLILFSIGLNYFFIRQGFGIRGVAVATSITYFLFFLAVFTYAYSHLQSWLELLRTLAFITAIFIYFSLIAWAINRYPLEWPIVWASIVKCGVFTLLMLPLVWHIEKREKIIRHAFESLKTKLGIA